MTDLGLALAAGLVAAINPCGFALLPVYLTLLVLGDDSPGRVVAVRRALAATAAMTAGFVVVFGVVGLVISPVAGALYRVLPWFTVGFGALLVLVAVWLLAGRQLPSFGLRPVRGPKVRRSAGSMVLFGAAYALASLSCTIAPFLAIVVSSFRAGSVLHGVGLFVAYATGMGLLVGVAALAVALSRPTALAGLRRWSRPVPDRRRGPARRRWLRRLLRLVRAARRRRDPVIAGRSGCSRRWSGWSRRRAWRGSRRSSPCCSSGRWRRG